MMYDGFISYSHAADGLLAPRLQAGLQRFAKPWWKRRAVRLFRDESSLSANPHLWSSITEALDTSGWFVLLLSPEAAGSEWVGQEIEYWTAHRDRSRILPVVTDGEFGWADGDVSGDAVPAALGGVFAEEPRWVDLRWAKDEDQLDLQDPRFADAVADIGSALRGVPKDELASEEVRQHRRTVRTASAGGVALAVLAVLAGVLAIQSSNNAAEAERQAEVAAANATEAENNANAEAQARELADANAQQAEINAQQALESAEDAARSADLAKARELASESIGLVETDPELATLLSIHALDLAPEGSTVPAALTNALWTAGQSDRLVGTIDHGYGGWTYVSVSGDGERVWVSSENGSRAQMYDSDLNLLWEHIEDTSDSVTMNSISPDGRFAAVAVIDWGATARTIPPGDGNDELPSRILVFDAPSGALVHRLDYPACLGAEAPAFSEDGEYLAVSSGLDGCEREGSRHWVEVYDTLDWQAVAFLPHSAVFGGPVPEFDHQGQLWLFDPWGPAAAYRAGTFEPAEALAFGGQGDVFPDGSRVVVQEHPNLVVRDASTGAVADLLGQLAHGIALPLGMEISPAQLWAGVGTTGVFTRVFDLESGAEAYQFPSGPVSNLAFDDVNQRVFVAGTGGSVTVWDLAPRSVGVETTGELAPHTWVNANSFALSDEFGAMVAIDNEQNEWAIRLFNLDNGELLEDRGLRGTMVVALSADRFAFADSAGQWMVHDVGGGETTPFIGCETRGTGACSDDALSGYRIAPHPDGDSVLAFGIDRRGAFDGLIEVFDASGNLSSEWNLEAIGADPLTNPVVLLDDEVIVRSNEFMQAVDLETGEVLWSGTSLSVDLSYGGRYLAYLTPGSVRVVDLDSFEEIEADLTVPGPRGLSVAPDGQRVALGTAEGLVVMDMTERTVAQTLAIEGVSDIYWMDDETVVIGTNTGQFGVVSLSTEDFLAKTRAGLRRGLTESECLTYRVDPCPSLEELRGG